MTVAENPKKKATSTNKAKIDIAAPIAGNWTSSKPTTLLKSAKFNNIAKLPPTKTVSAATEFKNPNAFARTVFVSRFQEAILSPPI